MTQNLNGRLNQTEGLSLVLAEKQKSRSAGKSQSKIKHCGTSSSKNIINSCNHGSQKETDRGIRNWDKNVLLQLII